MSGRETAEDAGAAREPGGVTDASPCSDICLEYDVTRDNEETNEEEKSDGNNNFNSNDGDDDIVAGESMDRDSLDEGLGDISSDGEVAESPELKIHGSDNNNEEAPALCAKISAVPDLVSNNLSSDCERERRPSRISFETPL